MIETSSPLIARDAALGYGRLPIIDGLNVSIPAGSVTTIIGPNGCGKSTLLRGFGRLLRTSKGEILLNGAPIEGMRTREIARRVAILPQAPSAPDGLTVAELVGRGRHPHQSWARQWSGDDEAEIGAALALTGMTNLAGRPINELSGGQRQRAWIAMTLAQGTEVLLLDEPTTYLDLAHAVDVLDLVDRLNDELGRTVLMVLHDLNLAARYSDRIIVMKEGRIVTVGTPRETITTEMLREVFGLSATVVIDDESGSPTVIPRGARRAARVTTD